MLHGFEGVDDDQPTAAAWAWQYEDAGGLSVVAFICVTGLFPGRWFGPKQASYSGNIGRAIAVSEETVVANAMQAFGQDVDQEAADELGCGQAHDRSPVTLFDPVVVSFERDRVGVSADQAAV